MENKRRKQRQRRRRERERRKKNKKKGRRSSIIINPQRIGVNNEWHNEAQAVTAGPHAHPPPIANPRTPPLLALFHPIPSLASLKTLTKSFYFTRISTWKKGRSCVKRSTGWPECFQTHRIRKQTHAQHAVMHTRKV